MSPHGLFEDELYLYLYLYFTLAFTMQKLILANHRVKPPEYIRSITICTTQPDTYTVQAECVSSSFHSAIYQQLKKGWWEKLKVAL
jgi:hypothetical protein